MRHFDEKLGLLVSTRTEASSPSHPSSSAQRAHFFFLVTLSGFNENHCRSALKGLKFRSSDPSDLFLMLFGCFL